jgi:CBS domain-containing protein
MVVRAVPESDRVEPSSVIGAGASVLLFTGDTVATVAPEATLQQVTEELVADDVGLLVVGTVEDVKGVVSERDVVRAVALGRTLETPVMDVASTRLVWCDATATVGEVAELMLEQYVRHVLVEDAGRFVGVVSARDLLGAYVAGPD